MGQNSVGNPTAFLEGYISNLRITKGEALWTSTFTPPTEPYTTTSGTVLLLHPDGDDSESQHTLTFNNDTKNYCAQKVD